MLTASLRSTFGRALLIGPPDWGRVVRFVVTARLLAAWLPATVRDRAAQRLHGNSHAMVPGPEA